MKGLLKDKKVIIIGAVVVFAIIATVLFVVFGGSDKEKNENNNKVVDKGVVTEKDLETSYGLTGKGAVDIVKTIFNGDSFEFSYTINADAKYVVTAKSKVTGDNTTLKFVVDPITKSFYEED